MKKAFSRKQTGYQWIKIKCTKLQKNEQEDPKISREENRKEFENFVNYLLETENARKILRKAFSGKL